MKKLKLISSLLLLSSCTVGPDYHEPSVCVPESWQNIEANNEKKPRNVQEEVKWWENFKDPILTQLVREAVKSNYDLKVAFATIYQARATLLGAEAALSPEIDGIGAFSHNENSLNTSQFSNQQSILPITPTVGGASFPGANRYFNLYRTGLTTAWEMDLFGRLRRGVESAEASLEAQVDDMHGVMLSIIAQVASQYINLRSFQKQLEVTQKSLESWDSIYKLNLSLLKAGLATDIDVAQAKTSRDQTEASLPPLRAFIKTTIHQLSILTGRPPACLYDLLSKVGPIPYIPTEIFAGVPCELLKRRPDIRSAERTLAAANAQIGVAEGSLYPIFTFSGTIGYQSNLAQNFISPGSGFYSFGPGFTWDLIDFGRVRAKINSAKAIRDETFYQYKSTLLNALADVENSLVNYAEEARRYPALISAYEASKTAADVSLLRFQSGLITFLVVYQAQLTYQAAILQMVQSHATLALNSVALYKALGGGWEIDKTCWLQYQPPVLSPVTGD
ncbi:MAG TPA: efflux transporter outer membrane subunit, partial [Alphaproteobacteria bacterium]|nr:efflux transporter outer membrane subunit [Alphaproteobacteria bacterium]